MGRFDLVGPRGIYVSILGLKWFGAVQGSLGDLRRATSGEGETEPKQIGEGTLDSTGLRICREP